MSHSSPSSAATMQHLDTSIGEGQSLLTEPTALHQGKLGSAGELVEKKLDDIQLDRLHLCPQSNCTVICKRFSDLQRHIESVHLGLKEFWCPVDGCKRSLGGTEHLLGKAFTRKDKRGEHVRKVHKDYDGDLAAHDANISSLTALLPAFEVQDAYARNELDVPGVVVAPNDGYMDSSPLTVLFDGSHFDLGANSTSSHGFEHHLRYNGDVADTAYSRAMDYTNYGNPPAMDAFAQTNGLNGYIYASTSAHAQGPTDGHDISYATGNGYTNTSTSFPNLTGNHNISYNANNAQGYAQSTTGPLAGASNFSPSTTYIDNGIMNSNSNTNQTRYDGLNANAGFTNYGFGMPSNYLVGAGTYQEQLATFEHDVLTNQGGKAYEGDGNRDEGDIFHQ